MTADIFEPFYLSRSSSIFLLLKYFFTFAFMCGCYLESAASLNSLSSPIDSVGLFSKPSLELFRDDVRTSCTIELRFSEWKGGTLDFRFLSVYSSFASFNSYKLPETFVKDRFFEVFPTSFLLLILFFSSLFLL